jgi:hypothetical protein
VHITVDAHRVGGDARSGYGYGIFCRSDGSRNLYAFTIGCSIPSSQSAASTAGLLPWVLVTRSLQRLRETPARSSCASVRPSIEGRAAERQFWVNGELVLGPSRDTNDPYTRGAFGMHAVLGLVAGNIGDTLEVEVDNFESGAE